MTQTIPIIPTPNPGGQGGISVGRTGTVTVADILFANGAINQMQLDQLKAEGATTGKEYEEILNEHQWVTDEQLLAAKAQYYNIPFVKVNEIGISPEALNTIPQ